MVLVLAPLHREYQVKRVVVATYQSVTGSGAKGMQQLEMERKEDYSAPFYPHRIDLNLIPHGGDFQEDGYTSEEIKLQFETCKILNDESIRVTSTVVRVPVYGGHSEAANIEFENPFRTQDIREILANYPGIVIEDDPAENVYPMPWNARGRDEVFVGRIRRDLTVENGLNLWIVSDNLRKGAATNAIQIAEHLVEQNLVGG
jgi:aspartate-semialdehyde dehydrogenase